MNIQLVYALHSKIPLAQGFIFASGFSSNSVQYQILKTYITVSKLLAVCTAD